MQNDELLNLYKSLKSESELETFIGETDFEREGLFTEYKMKDPKDKFTKTDRKNFFEPLSAFANSEGGILFIGVDDAREGKSPKDRLIPIDDVTGFERCLRSFLIEATSPTIPGFQMHVIYANSSKTKGYIKCYIPESDITPHQAFDGRYYIRTVEGVIYMRHSQISDMFGKRQKPALILSINTKRNIVDSTEVTDIEFNFRNEGRSMAKYYGYLCKFEPNVRIIRVSEVDDVSSINDGIPTISYTNNVGVVHPNGITYNAGSVRLKIEGESKTIKGNITYFCENMLTKSQTLEIGEVGI